MRLGDERAAQRQTHRQYAGLSVHVAEFVHVGGDESCVGQSVSRSVGQSVASRLSNAVNRQPGPGTGSYVVRWQALHRQVR